jgi:hypothetical protein
VADGWCWFVLREEYCWLVAGGWFVQREKYCWLVADKPSEQAEGPDTYGLTTAAARTDALALKSICRSDSDWLTHITAPGQLPPRLFNATAQELKNLSCKQLNKSIQGAFLFLLGGISTPIKRTCWTAEHRVATWKTTKHRRRGGFRQV